MTSNIEQQKESYKIAIDSLSQQRATNRITQAQFEKAVQQLEALRIRAFGVTPENGRGRDGTPANENKVTQLPDPPKTFSNSTLKFQSFPENIENLGVPFIIIKMFEIRRDANGVPVGNAGDPASTYGTFTAASEEVAKILANFGLSPENVAAGIAANRLSGGSILATTAAGLSGQKLVEAFEELFKLQQGSLVSNPLARLKNFNTKRNIDQVEFAIALPMPENIAAQYAQNYEELSLTQSFGVLGGISQAISSMDPAKGGNLGLEPYIMEGASTLLGSLPGVSNANKALFFGTTGLAVNPQLEMIYNNPSLRSFQFDFVLTPKSQREAFAIDGAIKQLKLYSHPEIPEGTVGRYYIPPAQFEIEFFTSGRNENPFLFKTKKCVLRDITVDYTSVGTFASHVDGSPVQTRLSLGFQETSILSRADIVSGRY